MDTTWTNAALLRGRADRVDVRDPGDIPNYELLSFVKAGGFGAVWLARERLTGVRRAIKILCKAQPDRAAREIAGVRRYQRCAHNHPHLLSILTVGETEQCYFYVMEAADDARTKNRAAPEPRDSSRADDARTMNGAAPGLEPVYVATTLRTLMHATGPFGARAALSILDNLASGVAQLHAQGLAHYDLKPENVLIVEGQPKIADIGLVGPTHGDAPRAGTPMYMTPEGRADDLYALGRILYELLTAFPAQEFPRLPEDFAAKHERERTAALAIVNRACQTDPARRFASVADLRQAVLAALGRRRTWHARWQSLSRRGKTTAVLTTAFALAGVAWCADRIHARLVPRLIHARAVSFEARDLRFTRDLSVDGIGRALYPFLRVRGDVVSRAGQFFYALERPAENFVVDFQFQSRRPWGSIRLGVANGAGNGPAVWAQIHGQPDGLGLLTHLKTSDEHGVESPCADWIVGHPLPGVAYLLRLARRRDEVVLALWPLARLHEAPLMLRLPLPSGELTARYLLFESCADSPLDAIDLESVRVAAYSRPLDRADRDLPAAVTEILRTRQPLPAFLPLPLLGGEFPWNENLLAGRWHPYDSDYWMSIGNWSWWSGEAPEPGAKTIRCVPFSTERRKHLSESRFYGGTQLLRFDGAPVADFEARVRIRLRYVDPEGECQPFPLESHDGTVGLGLRVQDEPTPPYPWGGLYRVGLIVGPNAGVATEAVLSRLAGLSIEPRPSELALLRAGDAPDLARRPEAATRSELLSPAGFVLGVRAQGPRFAVFLNDRLILEAEDPDPDYFRSGRIALYASRLMATFDSLTVTPLE